MLSLISTIAAAACPLLVVESAGQEIGVDVGGALLSVDSLVQPSGPCPGGQQVTVVSENYRYRSRADVWVAEGEGVCVPAAALAPLGDRVLIASPAPGEPAALRSGTVLDCDDASPQTWDQLLPARPAQLAAAQQVHRAWEEHFGPVPLSAVPVSAWGYVALPLPEPLTDEEIALWADAEGLVTPSQREKGLTDLGPWLEGALVYAHFTGADARFSDVWGQPDAVVALIALAAGWHTRCLALPPPASPQTCALQIGDLAWYNAREPDPLGHTHHRLGRCVDLRLFRDDGSRYEARWDRPDDRQGARGGYSALLTAAFLTYATTEHPVTVAYFNDPAVIAAVPGVQARAGHDDHMHLCF